MNRKNRITKTTILCLAVSLMLLLGGCKKEEPEDIFVPEDISTGETVEHNEVIDEAISEKEEIQKPLPDKSDYVASDMDHESLALIVLGVGSDETQISATWYSKSNTPGKLVVAKAEEMSGNTFPVTLLTGESAPYTANFEDYYANAAVVNGLESDTEYCYMVGNENGWSSLRTFRTAPESGKLDIIVTGDIQLGTGDYDHINTADWNRIAADTDTRFSDYHMFLNMGDITSIPEDGFYASVLDTPLFKEYPTCVVLGNHDHGKVYQQHFSRPNQSEFGARNDVENGNFWFRAGDVVFMELNFMIDSVDILLEHRYFIKGALESNPDCKWTVVLMHYSPFSSVAKYQPYSDENRSYWMEVFDEFGIDVVLSGHDHAYTRMPIIKGGQAQSGDVPSVTNPDGTLYVTFGSASGSQYHDVSPSPWALKCLQTYTPHISTINFTDNTFRLTVYEADTWNVLDTFEIIKE